MSYKYFSKKELRCRCGCHQEKMDSNFIRQLEALREELGEELHVNSAYRCPDHNEKVSSTGRGGPHTTGKAIDLRVDRKKAFRVLELALEYGFTGIGVAQKGKDRFLHLDTLHTTNRPTIWSY